MALWDLLPTIAELTGFAAPPDTDGLSMLPLLKGDPQNGESTSGSHARQRQC